MLICGKSTYGEEDKNDEKLDSNNMYCRYDQKLSKLYPTMDMGKYGENNIGKYVNVENDKN